MTQSCDHCHPQRAPATGAAALPGGTIYTCPMHPQVRRNDPGSCPVCGMALEPLQPADRAGRNPELRDMSRRLCIGAALAVPLILLDMAGALKASPAIPPVAGRWIELALATPVVLGAGSPLLARGWASLQRRSLF